MTNDGAHSYTYDAEGNVLNVDGGSTAQYVYDAMNRRICVQTSGSTYEYAGRRTASWPQPSNTGNEGRIYRDGQQIAFRASDGTTYFDHQDWLGTERVRTNYTGATAAQYYSLPWGDGYSATIYNSAGDQDSLHLAGLEKDTESSTDHAQFRQYSHAQGHWTAPDPYYGSYDVTNPQSMNRYAYALNNPLSLIDPLGLACVAVDASGDGDDGDDGDDPIIYFDDDSGGQPCAEALNNDGTPSAIVDGGDPDPDPDPAIPVIDGYFGYTSNGLVGFIASNNRNNSNGKSPARQQCEANAKQQFSQSVSSLDENFWPNIKDSAEEGAVTGGIVGCFAAGAPFAILGPEAFIPACGGGIAAGASTGAIVSAAGSAGHTLIKGFAALAAYNAQMNACAKF